MLEAGGAPVVLGAASAVGPSRDVARVALMRLLRVPSTRAKMAQLPGALPLLAALAAPSLDEEPLRPEATAVLVSLLSAPDCAAPMASLLEQALSLSLL